MMHQRAHSLTKYPSSNNDPKDSVLSTNSFSLTLCYFNHLYKVHLLITSICWHLYELIKFNIEIHFVIDMCGQFL